MRMFTVDAFTRQPFKGNPAAVCLLDSDADDTWMRSVAAEMNLSETAFVTGLDGSQPYSLRWFTPAVEVALCGHATLATAHVLYSIGAAVEAIQFSTLSGILTVNRGPDNLINMDFPANPPESAPAPEGLTEALGVTPRWVGRSQFDILVEVESASAVRALAPDIAALKAVEARGVIVTAAADGEAGEADYVSRFFAPRVGVPEDPVTGSAHCVLAPYWSERFARPDLVGAQLSPRGGLVYTRHVSERVMLGGHAVMVMSADLHATPI
ncbi:PhzF family phenazine biosynthesis isomerase [Spongiactinospora sp. TRM90649]|uniref:PhzF family phenazine biosynthesis protein n=1 Tax=Spongiactinospora sp. TRM90649 TaxID=3031114 RepID=UPI0023F6D13F|nr:PhzF family phenazine biosynthesis isomerase [Spongiactinospora sp. TRM90649]MDF5757858.1 PhzF family phenazine biosynthesis isomerase [Spongiactinospora sp. TRM90649]